MAIEVTNAFTGEEKPDNSDFSYHVVVASLVAEIELSHKPPAMLEDPP